MSGEMSDVVFRLTAETGYHADLRSKIEARGGFFNAHLHIDRAGTLHFVEEHLRKQAVETTSAISLQSKHGLVSLVHGSPLYASEALTERIGSYLEAMFRIGTSRVDTTVDVTDDGLGTRAFDAFVDLKGRLAGRLDLRIGAYNPLGFRDDQPARWDMFARAAQSADFIAALPERDETTRYPEHIGFDESARRVIDLASSLGKEVHIHVDQANHQFESATEDVLDVLDEVDRGLARDKVWLIHAISPSAYDEARFAEMVERVAGHGLGVIICPSAALSMRQIRDLRGPMRNSIARVLEFCAAGVTVRIGSDNIFDITSPAGTLDLMNEVFVLAHAVRYFDTDVLAAFATGSPLSVSERTSVVEHLRSNAVEEQRVLDFLQSTYATSPMESLLNGR